MIGRVRGVLLWCVYRNKEIKLSFPSHTHTHTHTHTVQSPTDTLQGYYPDKEQKVNRKKV